MQSQPRVETMHRAKSCGSIQHRVRPASCKHHTKPGSQNVIHCGRFPLARHSYFVLCKKPGPAQILGLNFRAAKVIERKLCFFNAHKIFEIAYNQVKKKTVSNIPMPRLPSYRLDNTVTTNMSFCQCSRKQNSRE